MPDLLIILVVILIAVLFWRGPKNLPKIGEALGRGYKEAKIEATKAQQEIQARASGESTTEATAAPTAPAAAPTAAAPTAVPAPPAPAAPATPAPDPDRPA
jgi:Sec-independent protein translocase protein TatA